jgi:hypothetical protein
MPRVLSRLPLSALNHATCNVLNLLPFSLPLSLFLFWF